MFKLKTDSNQLFLCVLFVIFYYLSFSVDDDRQRQIDRQIVTTVFNPVISQKGERGQIHLNIDILSYYLIIYYLAKLN